MLTINNLAISSVGITGLEHFQNTKNDLFSESYEKHLKNALFISLLRAYLSNVEVLKI